LDFTQTRRTAVRRVSLSKTTTRRSGNLLAPRLLGKQHELKGHVRGALNNGATTAEIQEVLLHASIYCGVPAAVEAFRAAAEVVDGPA
jgi:alkylhydroperoxidase/carboxymuconolactone decarboxylase family protein YurZ